MVGEWTCYALIFALGPRSLSSHLPLCVLLPLPLLLPSPLSSFKLLPRVPCYFLFSSSVRPSPPFSLPLPPLFLPPSPPFSFPPPLSPSPSFSWLASSCSFSSFSGLPPPCCLFQDFRGQHLYQNSGHEKNREIRGAFTIPSPFGFWRLCAKVEHFILFRKRTRRRLRIK